MVYSIAIANIFVEVGSSPEEVGLVSYGETYVHNGKHKALSNSFHFSKNTVADYHLYGQRGS